MCFVLIFAVIVLFLLLSFFAGITDSFWAYPVGFVAIVGALYGDKLIRQKREENKQEQSSSRAEDIFARQNFKASQKYYSADHHAAIGVDMQAKKICIITKLSTIPMYNIIDYKDLMRAELVEDGVTITQTSRVEQIAGMAVGGLLLGGAGAIVGGLSAESTSSNRVKKIELKITVNDVQYPIYTVCFLDEITPETKASQKYKDARAQAEHWNALIAVFIKRADQEAMATIPVVDETAPTEERSPSSSIADELRKLSELKKDGIITQEEFEQQKKKLLE
ncbi:SHOCT domain-containing protein [Tumebacillus sp. DT12]|uniref:SHOCT domain-containing protein n=1 Tax=Tumebacillus lacus TaxID=2995335 RepID=A0ABT3X0I8_9BACL|nr:SHOCT domain-containing protein [Tumebacillus lacus]MCX7570422.1 SHOCT domain-containing protein [Tumebacillus lacus]